MSQESSCLVQHSYFEIGASTAKAMDYSYQIHSVRIMSAVYHNHNGITLSLKKIKVSLHLLQKITISVINQLSSISSVVVRILELLSAILSYLFSQIILEENPPW